MGWARGVVSGASAIGSGGIQVVPLVHGGAPTGASSEGLAGLPFASSLAVAADDLQRRGMRLRVKLSAYHTGGGLNVVAKCEDSGVSLGSAIGTWDVPHVEVEFPDAGVTDNRIRAVRIEIGITVDSTHTAACTYQCPLILYVLPGKPQCPWGHGGEAEPLARPWARLLRIAVEWTKGRRLAADIVRGVIEGIHQDLSGLGFRYDSGVIPSYTLFGYQFDLELWLDRAEGQAVGRPEMNCFDLSSLAVLACNVLGVVTGVVKLGKCNIPMAIPLGGPSVGGDSGFLERHWLLGRLHDGKLVVSDACYRRCVDGASGFIVDMPLTGDGLSYASCVAQGLTDVKEAMFPVGLTSESDFLRVEGAEIIQGWMQSQAPFWVALDVEPSVALEFQWEIVCVLAKAKGAVRSATVHLLRDRTAMHIRLLGQTHHIDPFGGKRDVEVRASIGGRAEHMLADGMGVVDGRRQFQSKTSAGVLISRPQFSVAAVVHGSDGEALEGPRMSLDRS